MADDIAEITVKVITVKSKAKKAVDRVYPVMQKKREVK